MSRTLHLVAIAMAIAIIAITGTLALAFAQAVPDPKLTAGAIRPGCTAAQICDPTFRTDPFRDATKHRAVLVAVCKKYGHPTNCPSRARWELDDLISVENCGANVAANLWTQPIKEARVKDHRWEDAGHKYICEANTDAERNRRLKWWQDLSVKDWREGMRQLDYIRGKEGW